MTKRPWVIILLAILHPLAIIGNVFINSFATHMTLPRYLSLVIQPQNLAANWFFYAAPILAGVAIFLCKKWSYYLYVLLMLGLFYMSWESTSRSNLPINPAWLVLVFTCNIAVVGFFLIPAVSKVYFDPRMRWWESKPRYFVNWPGSIQQGDTKIDLIALNFSRCGLYFEAQAPQLLHNTRVELTLHPTPQDHFTFEALVARHSQSARPGFGIRFIHTRATRKVARTLEKQLLADGKLILSRTGKQEEPFMKWLKRVFQSGGKALIPKM